MVTERNLKTGGKGLGYSLRATESTKQTIGSQQSQLRGGVAGIYTQKKLNELDKDTQDQDNFVKEIKTMFSDKSKAADAKWKIETFKQEK